MRRSPKTEARSNRSKRSIALLRSKRFNAKIRGGFARFDNSQNVKMSRDYHRHPEGGMRTYNAACGDESSLKFATRRSRRTTNEIDSKRRTIQSQAESGFLTRRRPSIVKSHFLYYRPRITNGAMKKAGLLSILFVVVLLAVAVIAEAQQPAKIPRIVSLAI